MKQLGPLGGAKNAYASRPTSASVESKPRGRFFNLRNAAWAAAALAATAIVVNRKAAQAEREHPPRGKFVVVNGVRVHVRERGTGTPIVLLHGNGSMSEDFEISGIVDALAQSHRVILIDRPGFGYTTRPRTTIWTPAAQAALMLAVLTELGVHRPLVVAHSWGTLVALEMASLSQHVRGLVLLSGFYFPTPRTDVILLSGPAIPGVGDLISHTLSPVLARALWPQILAAIFGPAPIAPRFRRYFPVWLALRPSQLRASAADVAMMIPGAASVSKRYAQLGLPVTIVTGDGDLIVEPELHAQALHRVLPNSTLTVLPHVGHMVHHTEPKKVAALIATAAADLPQALAAE